MSVFGQDTDPMWPSGEKKIGRRGFKDVFNHWQARNSLDPLAELEWKRSPSYDLVQQGEKFALRGPFGYYLCQLGTRSLRMLERRCANLTHQEALTVIMALEQSSIMFDVDEPNPVKRAYQKQVALWQLAFDTSKMVAMAPVACAVDPFMGTPSRELMFASSKSQETIESVRQAFKEAVFGLSRKRTNQMRGYVISAVSDRRIPDENNEWFGANWRKTLPVWETLIKDNVLSRSRYEALRDDEFRDVPSVMIDGAL